LTVESARAPFLSAGLFVLGVALAGCSPAAAAQPAKAPPGDSEDLRAVYATQADVADGKRVAESSCARCHGANGISVTRGVPHLAGQRAAYLHLQLRAYRQTARVQSAMDGIVKFLSDDALVKVAAYYASLDPPRPVAAAPAAKAGAPKSDPVAAGKAAAASCAGCHGENGVSKTPGMPSLVALDPKYFVTAMNAYKSGQRKHDVMKSLAAGLSDADLGNVALYYGLQKPAPAQTPSPGDPAAGKKAAASCGACHGDLGVSGNPVTPSLAGQDVQYLAAATLAYKDGARKHESMKAPAAALDQRAVRDIAAFYAAQQPQAVSVRRPLTVAEWTERCDRCHGVNGNSTDPLVPALAAQREDWLEPVLHAYRKGVRKSTAMAAMSALMSEGDVKDVAAHYARQPARSISYIVVPGKKP
jgi:cytochrome c553